MIEVDSSSSPGKPEKPSDRGFQGLAAEEGNSCQSRPANERKPAGATEMPFLTATVGRVRRNFGNAQRLGATSKK